MHNLINLFILLGSHNFYEHPFNIKKPPIQEAASFYCFK